MGRESCTNAKAKYSSSVEPPDPSVHFYHWSQMTSIDTVTQWREDWSSASVLNHTTVTDPTIRQPGFNLPRHTWSLMNHFQTGHGLCRANSHIRGLAQSPSCDSGQRQTTNHTADTCPLTKSEGGLNLLHEADDGTIITVTVPG